LAATAMTEKVRTNPKFLETTLDRIPLKRFAEPEDVAGAFAFLATDDAANITIRCCAWIEEQQFERFRSTRGLWDTHPKTLLAECLKALVDRPGIDPSRGRTRGSRLHGAVRRAEPQHRRNAWLQASYPVETPAITIDRRCGSAQSAVSYATALIASGAHDLVIAARVEHIRPDGKSPASPNRCSWSDRNLAGRATDASPQSPVRREVAHNE
jgi:Thiolase, N-terminal domain/Enoyl-(Acyl carrier protein) reductase